MRFALVLLALSTAVKAEPLKPVCRYGDEPCLAKLEAQARNCLEVKSLQVGKAQVRWIRCAAPVPDDGDPPVAPLSFVLVRGPGGGMGYLVGGDEDDIEDELYDVERVAGTRIFFASYLNPRLSALEHWALLDLGSLPFLQLALPHGFTARAKALLHKNEVLGFRGWEVFVKDGTLRLETEVKHPDDPRAGERGEVHATLVVRGRRLVLQRIERVPPPP